MPHDLPEHLQSEALASISNVAHGFFTRHGGVSTGIYASLNCGFGSSDEPQNVAENRARISRALEVEPKRLTTVHQVHGTNVHVVREHGMAAQPERADAVATNVPGYALGILTADCAPVLLADPDAGVAAAAHAGWRGALDGIIGATISAMSDLGASPTATIASIGPCIGSATYEVGPEFPNPFVERDPENSRFFQNAPRSDHFIFDLPGFVAATLDAAGVGVVEHVGGDTLSEENRFFSYRRACHKGEPDYGRQLSAIALSY